MAKLGISQAVTVTQKHIYLVHTLFEYDKNCDFWFIVARNLINVLKVHQCSSFFKEPVPEELEDYYKVVKEPRDLSLVAIKLNNWEYKTLHKFLDDLEYVWKDIKLFFKPNSFFWKNADVLEIFVRHLIKDEKIIKKGESDDNDNNYFLFENVKEGDNNLVINIPNISFKHELSNNLIQNKIN